MTERAGSAAQRQRMVDALHRAFVARSATFTRPANTTAYAAGDRVCGTVAATVLEVTDLFRAGGEAVRIDRLRLAKSGPTITNGQFKVHLFTTLPVTAVADNAAFNTATVLGVDDVASHLGAVAVTLDYGGTIGGRGNSAAALGIIAQSADVDDHQTSVWAIVEALAAYTPASAETFTLTVEATRL